MALTLGKRKRWKRLVSARVRLEVGAPAHGGHCVARHEGRVVFVRHAIPGELVEAELTDAEEGARFWRADAVKILEPSTDRVINPWAEAGPGGVGGGELAHVTLPAQRAWKLAVLRDAFGRFAKQPFLGELHAAPGDDERGGLRYRTRVTAVADPAGRAAMRSHRSHTLRALQAMPLAVEAAEEVLLGQRFPGGVTVKVAAPGAGDQAHVVVNGDPWRGGKADTRVNAPRSVRETVSIVGQTYEYRVATGGFWQVHREAPAVLAGEVLTRVGDAGAVLDLYAGSGLFTLPLAAAGREVTSLESDANAVRHARRNLYRYPNATVIEGDVRRTLRSGELRAAVAVLDPPRSGAGKATLDALVAVGPHRIVYVACDPVALARDTALLDGHGYTLVDAQAWDLFPMTHHMEAVATFERR